jgi:uncharacterized protein
MTFQAAPKPVTPAERVAAIDVLRGLALFGVLAINLETAFRVSLFQQFLPQPPAVGLDRMVEAVLKIFFDFKALALFSLLFGVGLAIQYDRLGWTGARAILLLRRLLALLAFGLIHLILIWNGDILTEYALCGLVLLPFLFGKKVLMTLGSLLCLGWYVLNPFLPVLTDFPAGAWLQDVVAQAAQAYGHGGYGQVFAQRLRELPGIFSLEAFVFPRTLGLMLLGALAWRSGVIGKAGERARTTAACGAVLVTLGLTLTFASTARQYSGWPDMGRIGTVAENASAISLALGYAALVLAACATRAGAAVLAWARPLGRAAFTNYILQSVILGFVFYGYGLGLFNRLTLAQGLGLTVLLYATQALVSGLWLKRFRYGPLEWLWRSLMYGRVAWDLPSAN